MTDTPAPAQTTSTTTLQTIETTVVAALKNKQLWLDWAEITDAWRIVPRVIIFVLLGWNIYLIDRIWTWYAHLAVADRTTADAALIGTMVATVTGLFTLSVKFYQSSGRQWTGQPPIQS